MKQSKITKTIDQNLLSKKPWILEDTKTLSLKSKIESVAVPLKDWDIKIYIGILTGYNDAFIIDTVAKDEILKHCLDDDERKRTVEIIKPILKGRDIKRYKFKWNDLWLINSHNGKAGLGRIEVENGKYPALFNYLKQFESKAIKRDSQGKHWTNLRNCAYLSEFEKEKIMWAEIVQKPSFILADNSYYPEATTFIMTGNDLKYLIAFFNSDVVFTLFTIFYMGGGLGEKGKRYKKAYFEQLPIPRLNPNIPSEKETYDRLCDLSLEMMELHKIDINESRENIKEKNIEKKMQERIADRICEVDSEINRIIYKLYKLTDDEIEIIEDRL